MNKQVIRPLILCGGIGKRLWPLSTAKIPKQFLNLLGERSLLEETLNRVSGECYSNPILVASKTHENLVDRVLAKSNKSPALIILEPMMKNTAVSVILGALSCSNPNDLLLIMPSDHYISDNVYFNNILMNAVAATHDSIIIFGVEPTYPATGYGYINVSNCNQQLMYVNSFIEKPTEDLARELIKSKDNLWNSGYFLAKASVIIAEFKKYNPELFQLIKKSFDFATINKNKLEPKFNDLEKIEIKSIDYLLLEKTNVNKCLRYQSDWNDLGTWSSLLEFTDSATGNYENGMCSSFDATKNILYSTEKKITALGVNNLAVIESNNNILIADLNKINNIKYFDQLISDEDIKVNLNRFYRPWGYYDEIGSGPGFKIKRIVLNPLSAISLQRHRHRSEHWIVVQGVGSVILEDNIIQLNIGDAIDIPKTLWHRLKNDDKNNILEIVEIQFGQVLIEEDIERKDDLYGR
jgi:mannose-1-phosphate guanylyltransferase/mannose-6-phosphate isomerase